MRRRLAMIIGCASLSACAAANVTEPVIKTVTVEKAVPVSCVPADMPQAPAYPDTRETILAAQDAIARARLVEQGWGIRDLRLRLLEGVISNCRR